MNPATATSGVQNLAYTRYGSAKATAKATRPMMQNFAWSKAWLHGVAPTATMLTEELENTMTRPNTMSMNTQRANPW